MNLHFTASVIPGSGLGKKQNVPTLNLSLQEIPKDLREGIYACCISFDAIANAPAVMHYGPRPVHQLPLSCEIHLLDHALENPPAEIGVEIVECIRDVRDFENPEQLLKAIHDDLFQARVILSKP
jgi:FAD synthase